MTAVDVSSAPASKHSFREVWLITVGHSLTHWYPATFYLLLPLIGRELGLSYVQIGSILTTQAVCGALSNIPGGLIVDSVPRKGLLMAASLFWVGAPYLLMGFSHEYWTLLTCAGLVGMGNNLWHPTAIPLLAQRFPERKALAVSIHGMGGNVGDAVAPLVAGFLLGFLSWRNVVVVNVLPGVLMACTLLFLLGNMQVGAPALDKPKPRRTFKSVIADFGVLLGNRTLVMLCVTSIFRSMTQGALMTFLPLFLASQLEYPPAWIGACMAGLQVAGFIGTPIAGHLADKTSPRSIMMSSMAMSAAILLSMAIAGNSPWFVFFVSFLGFFMFAVRAVLQAWLLDATPPEMGGRSIAILFAIQAIGSGSGPLIGGILADRYGLWAVFYFLACTIVIANMLVFLTPVQPRHRFEGAPAE